MDSGKIVTVVIMLIVTPGLQHSVSAETIQCFPLNQDFWTGHVTFSAPIEKINDQVLCQYTGATSQRRAWVKTDLTAIPDVADIISANVRFHVSDASGTVYFQMRHLELDPVPASAVEINTALALAPQVSTNATTTGTGWRTTALNSAGLQAIEEALAQDWIVLGFWPLAAGSGYFLADGYTDPVNRPYLEVTYTAGITPIPTETPTAVPTTTPAATITPTATHTVIPTETPAGSPTDSPTPSGTATPAAIPAMNGIGGAILLLILGLLLMPRSVFFCRRMPTREHTKGIREV